MRKKVKLGWVFFINLRKRVDYGSKYKTRGSNFYMIVWKGYELTIGMPWNSAFVKYELYDSFCKSTEKMEKSNSETLKYRRGLKIKMPKRTYIL